MKKRIYILLPLLLIMLIMGVDRVGADIFINADGTYSGPSGSCAGVCCQNTAGIFGVDGVIYGLRIHIYYYNDTDKTYKVISNKLINFWASSEILNKVSQNSDLFIVKNQINAYVPGVMNPSEDVNPSEMYKINYNDKVLTKERFNDTTIESIFSTFKNNNAFKNEFQDITYDDFKNEGQYYMLAEPVFAMHLFNKYGWYGNTGADANYVNIGTAQDFVVYKNDIYIDKNHNNSPSYECFDALMNPANGTKVFDNFLTDPYVDEENNLKINYIVNANSIGQDTRYADFLRNPSASGWSKSIIRITDFVPPTHETPPPLSRPALVINKHSGTIDNNKLYDGWASFRIEKCENVEGNICTKWNTDNPILNSKIKQFYWQAGGKIVSNKELTKGKYRIQETESQHESSEVYYEFNGANSENKKNNWYEFDISDNITYTINVYNVNAEEKSCEEEVKSIFSSNDYPVIRRFRLFQLYEERFEDFNGLVAFDEYENIINKSGAISNEDALNMCSQKSETYNPPLKCSGEIDLGTRINDDKIYSNTNFLRYIINNENSIYVGLEDIDCAVSFKVTTNFQENNEPVETGTLLWSDDPGKFEAELNCYGITKKNYTVKNLTAYWDSINNGGKKIGSFNGIVSDNLLPKFSMTIRTPARSEKEITLNTTGIINNTVLVGTPEINNIEIDGERYQEVKFTVSLTDPEDGNIMKYDKLCYSVDGKTDGGCIYAPDDGSGKGTPGFAISYDENFENYSYIDTSGILKLNYGNDSFSELCEYQIIPGPIEPPCDPKKEICDSSSNHPSKKGYHYNFEVRTIDTNNPFPGINGKDGEGRTVGSNWCTYYYIGKDIDGIKVGNLKKDDDVITNGDVLKLNMTLNSDSEEVKYADFNGDGITNNDDSIILQNYVGKLEKDFNCKNQGYLIQKYIKDRPNSNSTEAPMYTFTLKSNDIKAIREYNKDHNYNSFEPDKDNKLLSQFITNALNGTLTTNSLDYGREYTCKDNRGNEGC